MGLINKYIDENGIYQGPKVLQGSLRDPYMAPDFRPAHPLLVSLGRLQKVTGTFCLFHCPLLKDLGGLKTVTGNFHVYDAPKLATLGKLRLVGGTLRITGTPSLARLGDLHQVYNLEFNGANLVSDLGKLNKVKKNLFAPELKVTDFNCLQKIGGSLTIKVGSPPLPSRIECSSLLLGFSDSRGDVEVCRAASRVYKKMYEAIQKAPLSELVRLRIKVAYVYKYFIDQRLKKVLKKG